MNLQEQQILIWKRQATEMSTVERQETIVSLRIEMWEMKQANKQREKIVEEQLQKLEQIMINSDEYVKSLEQKVKMYELRENNP